MEETLEIALAFAKGQGASKIHRLKMRIGAMSGVVSESLDFAFEIVTAETIAAGAKLEIEQVPVTCWCHHCQGEFQPADMDYFCPDCQQLSFEIVKGKEIELTSLEVS